MKLVIDTNRLVAALVKSSITREIILSDRFDLYSPDYILVEIEKNRDFLIKKAKINVNKKTSRQRGNSYFTEISPFASSHMALPLPGLLFQDVDQILQ